MRPPKKRPLGSTGVEISELTMGTWGLCGESYGRVFAEQVGATFERAIEQGIHAFDVAPHWGNDGASEHALRAAVAGRRDEMVYVTRAGQVPSEYGLAPAFAPSELRMQCEDSLRRLATDRVDVLLLHHPTFDDLRKDELPQTMEALVQEGKVRTWGATVSNVDEARAALVTGAKVLMVPFHLLGPDLVWDLKSECAERGVGLLARSVLLYGLLSGRWSEKKRFTPDDHRMYRWSHEAIAAQVKRANALAAKIQPGAFSMLSVALQFVLAHEEIASAVYGPRTPAQITTALDALEAPSSLNVSDLQFIYNSTP